LEEFERVSSRDQGRSLENVVFRVSLGRALCSISQVALLIDLFVGCGVRCPILWWLTCCPDSAIANLQKKLEESSAARREADEKFTNL